MGLGFDEIGKHNECIAITPPINIKRGFYRCDKRFHIKDLSVLYETGKKIGYILIEGENSSIYISNGRDSKKVWSVATKRQKNQKKGGQSAPRIERIRQKKELAYIKNIGEFSYRSFTKNNILQIEGIILAGPGEMKYKVQNELKNLLKEKIIKVMTVDNLNFDEILLKSLEYLEDNDLKEEKNEINEIEDLIRINTDQIVFGMKEVNEYYKNFMLKKIIISSKYEKQFKEIGKCKIIIIKSHLLEKYGHMVGIKWY